MADRKLQLSDEALYKFEDFLRRLATVVLLPEMPGEAGATKGIRQAVTEAKALVDTYLPAPVDPLVREALKLQDDSDYDLNEPASFTNVKIHALVLAALKRGQELAHAEYKRGYAPPQAPGSAIAAVLYHRLEPAAAWPANSDSTRSTVR